MINATSQFDEAPDDLAFEQDTDGAKPVVLIFKPDLLPYSETFILEQARFLQRYRPVFVGLRRVPGLDIGDHEILNHGGHIGRLREYAYAWSGIAPDFLRRVARRRPALVHAHFGPSGVLAMPLCRRLGVPLVVSAWGYDVTVSDRELARGGYIGKIYVRRRKQLRRPHIQHLAISRFMAERLQSLGVSPRQITLHYAGIDTERFQPSAQTDRENVALFVGRLVAKKGCEHLLAAMSRVQQQLPEARLAIIGDGPLRADLERRANELGVVVEFLGAQPSDVVRDWMRRARVLCVPSITAPNGDSEGLPTVVIEAQACGLPVVGSRHAGIPEAVVDGETGFIADERDVDGLTAGLRRLLTDHDLQRSFGQAARDHVCRNFDIRRQSVRLERFYDSVRQAAALGSPAG